MQLAWSPRFRPCMAVSWKHGACKLSGPLSWNSRSNLVRYPYGAIHRRDPNEMRYSLPCRALFVAKRPFYSLRSPEKHRATGALLSRNRGQVPPVPLSMQGFLTVHATEAFQPGLAHHSYTRSTSKPELAHHSCIGSTATAEISLYGRAETTARAGVLLGKILGFVSVHIVACLSFHALKVGTSPALTGVSGVAAHKLWEEVGAA